MTNQSPSRTRVTSRTIRRTENHRKLVAALQQRQLSRQDIAALLLISESAVGKYARDLLEFGIATVRYSGRFGGGRPAYQFSGDVERAVAFVQEMERPARELAERRAMRATAEYHTPRPEQRVPLCDPLLAALYGSSSGNRGDA